MPKTTVVPAQVNVMPAQTNKTYLTSGEAAKLFGCSSYWINILINKGQLDTHRIGNSGWHRISVKSLEKYAAEHDVDLDWSLLE